MLKREGLKVSKQEQFLGTEQYGTRSWRWECDVKTSGSSFLPTSTDRFSVQALCYPGVSPNTHQCLSSTGSPLPRPMRPILSPLQDCRKGPVFAALLPWRMSAARSRRMAHIGDGCELGLRRRFQNTRLFLGSPRCPIPS